MLQSGEQSTKLDLLMSWSVKRGSTPRTTTQPTSKRSVSSSGTNASPRHSKLTGSPPLESFASEVQLTNTTKEVSYPALMLLLCSSLLTFISAVEAEAAGIDFSEDIEEEDEPEDEEAEDESKEMPATKKPPPKKKSTTAKTPKKDLIDEIVEGVEGLTTEGDRYSMKTVAPWKTHPYMKNDHYLVKGEVFTNPVPENMIEIDLTECGNFVEVGIGTHLIVGSTAHHKLDVEDDGRLLIPTRVRLLLMPTPHSKSTSTTMGTRRRCITLVLRR